MIVVADTSVILNLALVGQEELLAALFREVFIPPAVQAEFSRLVASAGRFGGLGLPAWIQVRGPVAIPERIAGRTDLAQGEVEALALAVEMEADAVLIDESAGRAAALELGLTPVGALGILVRAKNHGQLAAVAPVVDALLTRAHFRVAAELLREVLRMAGEGP